MNTAPVYHKPLVAPYESAINFSYWETVTGMHEEGRYKDAIIGVLDYIDGALAARTGNPERTRFTIPHGSITVYLDIDENGYNISAPFVSLPEAGSIPLLRQVAEINFGTLVLAQIVLKGNDLHFQYSAPLDASDPYKVYRVLEEICVNADDLDDLFVEKFRAHRIARMQVQQLSPEALDQAHQVFVQCLNEGLEDLNYYEGKRMYGFGWDAVFLALTKINYVMQPQGFLKSEFDKNITMLNADTPINERLNKARGALQKFLTLDKAKFAESMYIVQLFISGKTKSDLNWIKEYFGDRYKSAKSELDSSNFNGAALTFMVALYNLMYNYHIPAPVYARFSAGLEQAGGKPWNEAALTLQQCVDQVLAMQA